MNIQAQNNEEKFSMESLTDNTSLDGHPAFLDAKYAKIIIMQSYGKADKINLPIKVKILKLIKYAGVIESDANYDIIIKVEIEGSAIAGKYVGDFTETNYTGAQIKGSIYFETKKGDRISKQFQNKIEPPIVIGKYFKSPNDAPFIEAFENILVFPFLECAVNSFGINPILSALNDNDIRVRTIALDVLGDFGDPRAVEAIIAKLNYKDYGIKLSAIEALGKIGDPKAVEPLIRELNSTNSTIRSEVVRSLGNIGDLRSFNVLLTSLNDKDDHVRYIAILSLAKMGDPRAVEPLILTLRDDDNDVRSYKGIKRIQGSSGCRTSYHSIAR